MKPGVVMAPEVAQAELFRWVEAIGGEIPDEVTRPAGSKDDETAWEKLAGALKAPVKAMCNGALVLSADGTELTFTPQRKWDGSAITLREPNGGVVIASTKEDLRAIAVWATITQGQLVSMKQGDVAVLLGLFSITQICAI
jgi:hypothetical protein